MTFSSRKTLGGRGNFLCRLFRTQGAGGFARPPHFRIRYDVQLLCELLLVVRLAARLQNALRLCARSHSLVSSSNTGFTAFLNFGFQSRAPRWAVAEQLAYIQSMPFSPTRRIRLSVNSSTVSLNASLGLWPCLRRRHTGLP